MIRSFTRPHNEIGHEPKSRAAAVIRLYKPKMPKLSAMWKPRMRVMIVPSADIITVRRKRERPGRGKVIFLVSEPQCLFQKIKAIKTEGSRTLRLLGALTCFC